jgi:hypothetical protein
MEKSGVLISKWVIFCFLVTAGSAGYLVSFCLERGKSHWLLLVVVGCRWVGLV